MYNNVCIYIYIYIDCFFCNLGQQSKYIHHYIKIKTERTPNYFHIWLTSGEPSFLLYII